MKFDLRSPCKNCPFRTDETAIRFSCRERAEEIEESAYRNGFPCHLSATIDEDDDDAGYEFGENTQHCAGALLLYMRDGDDGNVAFQQLSDPKQERVAARLDYNAPVFNSADEFLDSYGARPMTDTVREALNPDGRQAALTFIRLALTEYADDPEYTSQLCDRALRAYVAALAQPVQPEGWRAIDEQSPEPGRRIVALYSDGSGAELMWAHDDGFIDADGDERDVGESFGLWAYLPDNVRLFCEEWANDPMILTLPPAPAPTDTGRG